MKTTTYQDVLNAAAEFAMRTRDQLPLQEQTSLQFFLAAEFYELRNQRTWPELIPPIMNVQAANRQFSKNVGEANEIGDILCVLLNDPETCGHRARAVSFFEGDDVVYVETNHSNLYVEYVLPYPSVAWPDLTQMNLATFLQTKVLLKFRNVLAHRGASHLLASDGNAVGQAAQWKLAEQSLTNEIFRLPPDPPWRRTMKLNFPPKHHHHHLSGC